MQRTTRLKRELQMLEKSPPHGISCWQEDDVTNMLKAKILGSDGTPYAGGIFELNIFISDRYPFEPPKLTFVTPIYHPNIDTGGRICLDTLKMPPQGAWKPSLNLGSVLTTIQQLMSEPNPDDPLMADIASEYKYNHQTFMKKAKDWTDKHAKESYIQKSKSQSLQQDDKTSHTFDETANNFRKRNALEEENKQTDSSISNLKRLKKDT